MNIMFSVCCDDIHFYSDGDTEVYIVVREEGNPFTRDQLGLAALRILNRREGEYPLSLAHGRGLRSGSGTSGILTLFVCTQAQNTPQNADF